MMKVVVLTGAFYLIARSHALKLNQPHDVSNVSQDRIGASASKSAEISGMSCTAISEYDPSSSSLCIGRSCPKLACENVFVDSNDAIWSLDVGDTSYVWAADGSPCVGTWIELTLPGEYTVDIVEYRQRFSPGDQGNEMSVTLKSSSGAVLSTQAISFANVNVENPLVEAFNIPATPSVTSVRFEYTRADTATCGAGGSSGHLGAKRIRVFGIPTTPTTTAPAGDGAATGDPHLQNVHGERFDLMMPGMHTLINIPRGERVENALLRVDAEARRMGEHCEDIYFIALNITGSWAYAKQAEGYHYSSHSAAHGSAKWIALGNIKLKVVQGLTESGVQYLNFYVKHLGQAGFAVGGLLGEDDHADVSTLPPACIHVLSLSGNRFPKSGHTSSLTAASFA